MGKSKVGGSIIGLMLDLTRELFWNSWGPMEESIGKELVKIGARVAALKKETMGKVAICCDNGMAKYPVSASYDMGWQKASKTYGSMSGQGLMIGHQTKGVIAVKNYSMACLVCQRHETTIEKNETPDIPVREHNCPRNHDGSFCCFLPSGFQTSWAHNPLSQLPPITSRQRATNRSYSLISNVNGLHHHGLVVVF